MNGATVLTYPSGEFNIVVSEYERDNVQFGEKNVLEHARVVSVCFRSGTVLPFRFGTIFDTDDALRHAVRSNRRAFGQSVARLRGKAEMHLKLRVKDGSLREAMAEIVTQVLKEIEADGRLRLDLDDLRAVRPAIRHARATA